MGRLVTAFMAEQPGSKRKEEETTRGDGADGYQRPDSREDVQSWWLKLKLTSSGRKIKGGS